MAEPLPLDGLLTLDSPASLCWRWADDAERIGNAVPSAPFKIVYRLDGRPLNGGQQVFLAVQLAERGVVVGVVEDAQYRVLSHADLEMGW